MLLQQGMVLGGRYEISDKIGAGGMAIVYKAKDKKLERFVTIKVLREEFVADEDFVSRFKVEAQAAASLNNQNIVNVYDVGQDESIYYIVMEYIDGFTLKELISKRGPLDEKSVISISIQIAQALSHAHKNHIVHRDIKPQNILVAGDGTIKVTDFGIARAVTSKTVSLTGSAIGSVHYFSPEQARGGYVDERGDIYSLGIVMFELVTGTLPYDGDSPVVVAVKHLNDNLPNISSYNNGISKSLSLIIKKSTEKKIEERYQDVDSLIVDMKRALRDSTGAFVKKVDISKSPTVQISEDDVKLIRSENDSKHSSLRKETEQKYLDNEYEMLYDSSSQVDDDDDDDDYKRGERRIIIGAIVTALVIIGVISLVGYMMLKNQRSEEEPLPEVRVVPQLVDKLYSEAEVEVIELGLKLNISDSAYDSLVPENVITWQDAKEGSDLLLGDTINVWISLGKEKFEIPDVKKHDEEEAVTKITNAKMQPKVEHQYNHEIPIGIVIAQTPEAGEKYEKGTVVTLYVSQGEKIEKVVMPNVVDWFESDAIQELEAKGLVVGQSTKYHSDVYAKDKVISQSVDKDKEVVKGQIVSLIVSLGKKPAPVEEKPPEPEKPKTVSKEFTISAPILQEGVETVAVYLIKLDGRGATTVYEKEHELSEFPIKVNVSFTENAEIQLYLNTDYTWSDYITID